MSNLIITVIAIALVAVASLMGAYYGGSAFLNNTGAAGAATVLNEGQQLAGAWQSYMSDHYNQPPNDLSCLTGNSAACTDPNSGQYIPSIPSYPAAPGVKPGQIAVVSYNNGTSTHYYAIADVGAPGSNPNTISDQNATACYKIIKTASGFTGIIAESNPDSIINNAAGNGTFGCSPWSTGPALIGGGGALPPVGDYVMVYKLS